MNKTASVLVLGVAFLGTGCVSVPQVADDAWTGTRKVATDAFVATKGALEKLARYTKIKDLLKKNHDSADADDAPVKAVESRPKAKPGPGRRAPAPKRETFPVVAYKGQYGWPLEAGIISSEYGARWGRQHKGIDIAADPGEPILAAADGEVIYAGNGMRGYGNVVILRHDQRTTTLYAHNQALKVKVGEQVKAGQAIALLGSTGHSTGPHCHFEYRVDSETVNPRMRLPRTRIYPEEALLAEARTRKG